MRSKHGKIWRANISLVFVHFTIQNSPMVQMGCEDTKLEEIPS